MSSVGAGTQSVQLTVESRSKTGRRKSNQDVPIRVEVVPGRVYLVGVADGMGGYAGGEQASAAALKHVQRFGELLREHLNGDDKTNLRFIRERIEGLYAEVQREIQTISTSDPNLAQMGTTLVLAVVSGRYFFVANIGDSRAYLLYRDPQGQDQFRQITEDHTVSNDARRAGEKIALETPEAQKLGKALTRALRPNTPSKPELFPGDDESAPGFLGNDGDTLLLTSDGMYGSVPEDDVEVTLIESPTLQIALERLEERAYGNDSADNITTVAVDFGPRDPRRRASRRPVVSTSETIVQSSYAAPPAGLPAASLPAASPLPPPVNPTPPPNRRGGAPALPIILLGGAMLFGAGGFILMNQLRGSSAATSSPTPGVTAPASPEASVAATEPSATPSVPATGVGVTTGRASATPAPPSPRPDGEESGVEGTSNARPRTPDEPESRPKPAARPKTDGARPGAGADASPKPRVTARGAGGGSGSGTGAAAAPRPPATPKPPEKKEPGGLRGAIERATDSAGKGNGAKGHGGTGSSGSGTRGQGLDL